MPDLRCFLLGALLLGGCFPHEAGPRLSHFALQAPAIGEMAPPLDVVDLHGRSVRLSKLLDGRPVLLQFGSHSCPAYRYRRFGMQDLWRDYRERVHFVLVYTLEAHPVDSKSPYAEGEWDTWWNRLTGVRVRQPESQAERCELAEFSHGRLGYAPTLLVDTLDNSTWERWGAASSPAFVLDPEGRIVARQVWLVPDDLRSVLDRLLE